MSRPTRIRQPSSKLTDDFVVTKVAKVPKVSKELTKLSKAKNETTKSQSTKGINNNLNNDYHSMQLLSPVLRDRTNLIKEPTTKLLDVLKKGRQDKDTVDAKMAEKETKRTKVIKTTMNRDSENICNTNINVKKNLRARKENDKIAEIKKPIISSVAADNSDDPVVKTTQKNTITTRNLRKPKDNDAKLTTVKIKSLKNTAEKPQVEVKTRTRQQKIDVPDGKSTVVLKKTSESKLKEPKKLSATRRTVVNKSTRRRLSTNKVDVKSTNEADDKKFFKSKLKPPRVVLSHSKISPLKRPLGNKTKKAAMNNKNANKKITTSKSSMSFRLRQSTIHESFSKAKKVLRPRKVSRNYCEESQLIKNKKNLNAVEEKKGPVYKLTDDINKSNDDKEKVYDFVFDSNDSKERVTKKRRKRAARKPPAKKAKIVSIEFITKPTSDQVPVKEIDQVPVVKFKPLVKKKIEEKELKNDNVTTTVTAEIHSPPVETVENVDNESPEYHQLEESITTTKLPAIPRIVLDENLTPERRIHLTTTPHQPHPTDNNSMSSNNSNKFNLRPSMQFKTMINAPLLRKSLSPIVNDNLKNYIEIDSPWRAPSLSTFSRVKNVYQSTPQGKKFTTILSKSSLVAAQKVQSIKMNKISEQNDENSNVSIVKKSPEKIQMKNSSKSPRKFGTVISNINENSPVIQNSVQTNKSKSPRKFGTVISNINKSPIKLKSTSSERIKLPVTVEQSDVYDSLKENLPDFGVDGISQMPDETLHDKENLAPINKTPRKSPDERSDIPNVSPTSSEIINESHVRELTDNEPQPGPSGLQKKSPLIDTWNMKQLNLNKFLNLREMPTSTKISTAHGIFSDGAHSTPMVGKAKKKIETECLDVNNAFGFDEVDDETDDIDLSPINHYEKDLKITATKPVIPKKLINNNEVPLSTVKQPLRFSIGEIKKTLLPVKLNDDNKIIDEDKDKNNEKNCTPSVDNKYLGATKKDAIQAINFSDTFDNENHEIDKENIQEIPLFVDIEPIHFTQPPRYSYGHKRKRKVSYNTSGELDEDDVSDEDKKLKKKKKMGKAEREQKKKLDQWAKSMNNTFDEIEHFDLLVEKNN